MGGGTKAVWIGDPKSEKVILWFHGSYISLFLFLLEKHSVFFPSLLISDDIN